MRTRDIAPVLFAVLLVTAIPARAHRLDEYLQGTIISVGRTQLEAQMTLTPGVAVYGFLLSTIDTNRDGTISEPEQRAYAAQIVRDLTLKIDGRRLIPHMVSIRFPAPEEMKEGRGEIQLDFNANLPAGGGARKITLENHHQSRISAYQVNVLVPRDRDIRISAQNRNYTQSFYELDYLDAGVQSGAPASQFAGGEWFLGMIPLAFAARLLFVWRARDREIEGRGWFAFRRPLFAGVFRHDNEEVDR